MRKYLTKDEAIAKGWLTKSELRALRLKPKEGQLFAGEVWQGQGTYAVYDHKLCIPMRPYREPTPAQRQALRDGRRLRGTKRCITPGCTGRVSSNEADLLRLCHDCEKIQRITACSTTAQQWLDAKAVLLDFETTGVDDAAQIIEVSLIDTQGRIVLNTLVRPTTPIPAASTEIHGINDEDVLDAPTWPDVHDAFLAATADRPVIIFNAAFDVRIYRQTALLHGLPAPAFRSLCAMELAAKWRGERRSNGEFRWPSLRLMAQLLGIEQPEAHRSLADCLTTLAVLRGIVAATPATVQAKENAP